MIYNIKSSLDIILCGSPELCGIHNTNSFSDGDGLDAR